MAGGKQNCEKDNSRPLRTPDGDDLRSILKSLQISSQRFLPDTQKQIVETVQVALREANTMIYGKKSTSANESSATGSENTTGGIVLQATATENGFGEPRSTKPARPVSTSGQFEITGDEFNPPDAPALGSMFRPISSTQKCRRSANIGNCSGDLHRMEDTGGERHVGQLTLTEEGRVSSASSGGAVCAGGASHARTGGAEPDADVEVLDARVFDLSTDAREQSGTPVTGDVAKVDDPVVDSGMDDVNQTNGFGNADLEQLLGTELLADLNKADSDELQREHLKRHNASSKSNTKLADAAALTRPAATGKTANAVDSSTTKTRTLTSSAAMPSFMSPKTKAFRTSKRRDSLVSTQNKSLPPTRGHQQSTMDSSAGSISMHVTGKAMLGNTGSPAKTFGNEPRVKDALTAQISSSTVTGNLFACAGASDDARPAAESTGGGHATSPVKTLGGGFRLVGGDSSGVHTAEATHTSSLLKTTQKLNIPRLDIAKISSLRDNLTKPHAAHTAQPHQKPASSASSPSCSNRQPTASPAASLSGSQKTSGHVGKNTQQQALYRTQASTAISARAAAAVTARDLSASSAEALGSDGERDSAIDKPMTPKRHKITITQQQIEITRLRRQLQAQDKQLKSQAQLLAQQQTETARVRASDKATREHERKERDEIMNQREALAELLIESENNAQQLRAAFRCLTTGGDKEETADCPKTTAARGGVGGEGATDANTADGFSTSPANANEESKAIFSREITSASLAALAKHLATESQRGKTKAVTGKDSDDQQNGRESKTSEARAEQLIQKLSARTAGSDAKKETSTTLPFASRTAAGDDGCQLTKTLNSLAHGPPVVRSALALTQLQTKKIQTLAENEKEKMKSAAAQQIQTWQSISNDIQEQLARTEDQLKATNRRLAAETHLKVEAENLVDVLSQEVRKLELNLNKSNAKVHTQRRFINNTLHAAGGFFDAGSYAAHFARRGGATSREFYGDHRRQETKHWRQMGLRHTDYFAEGMRKGRDTRELGRDTRELKERRAAMTSAARAGGFFKGRDVLGEREGGNESHNRPKQPAKQPNHPRHPDSHPPEQSQRSADLAVRCAGDRDQAEIQSQRSRSGEKRFFHREKPYASARDFKMEDDAGGHRPRKRRPDVPDDADDEILDRTFPRLCNLPGKSFHTSFHTERDSRSRFQFRNGWVHILDDWRRLGRGGLSTTGMDGVGRRHGGGDRNVITDEARKAADAGIAKAAETSRLPPRERHRAESDTSWEHSAARHKAVAGGHRYRDENAAANDNVRPAAKSAHSSDGTPSLPSTFSKAPNPKTSPQDGEKFPEISPRTPTDVLSEQSQQSQTNNDKPNQENPPANAIGTTSLLRKTAPGAFSPGELRVANARAAGEDGGAGSHEDVRVADLGDRPKNNNRRDTQSSTARSPPPDDHPQPENPPPSLSRARNMQSSAPHDKHQQQPINTSALIVAKREFARENANSSHA